MNYFIKAKFIRLKSHHNRYLVAGSDGESVKQSKNGNTRQACWAVEVVQDKPNMICLRSCYDKFLTASEEPFLLGWTGKKALQTMQTDCNLSVQWEPISHDFYVKLQAPMTGKFLRANAGTPPWRDTVTVDVPERKATQSWVLWVVDILDDDAAISNFDRCSWRRDSMSLTHSSNSIACYMTTNSIADNVTWYNSSTSSVEYESDQSSTSGSPTSSTVGAYKPKQSGGMELFQNAKTVRLRSHHDKYLLADDDGESVCQDRHGGSKYARWTVEYVKSFEGVGLVRFKSCYNKYLTATDDDFLLGVTGKKVKQTIPRRLDSSIEWEPMRDGMQVKLKTRYGNFLRANGGVPPWRNSITHDVPSRSHTQDWVLWEIEVLEVYDEVVEEDSVKVVEEDGGGNKSKLERLESEFDASSWISPGHDPSNVKNEGRVINYNVVDDDGNIVHEAEGERSLVFNGSGVQELAQMLEEETGLTEVTLCSRSPLNGKLYPMRLALPPNHVKLHVFVVPSSSKAAADFALS